MVPKATCKRAGVNGEFLHLMKSIGLNKEFACQIFG